MPQTIKSSASCLAAGLLSLGCALSAAAAMTGGAFSVPVLVTLSGGTPASGGLLSVSGLNMGGPAASAANLSGGVFSLDTGAAPAVIVYDVPSADLGAAHCYPVPFDSSAGHVRITFTALTREARVKIFTLGGELVRSLEKADSADFMNWDVKNARGENVASGVYFFTVKSAGQTRTGKLMILR